MKRTRLVLFVLLVMAQVAIVGSMAASSQTILAEGERVTLATAPVDPRDLLRGDYVTLRYEISTLDRGLDWQVEPYEGQSIWVVLQPDRSGIARPVAVLGSPIDDVTAIRGTVTSPSYPVVVAYGIEAYFVPEGRGHEIERVRELLVVVALDDDGTAAIDHLIVDGRDWRSSDG